MSALVYRGLYHVAAVAMRWYYRQVAIDGAERIPQRGPVLLVVNHPNELVDALFAGLAAKRQLTFTGKATLFANPVGGAILRYLRVVPLRRAKDEAARDPTAPVDPRRNAEAFAAIHEALADGEAVLIFPEGVSWDEPHLAPLRTGAARIALSARSDGGVRGLRIVPVGINYERKDGVRSRVLVEVGEPLDVDAWPDDDVDALTAELSRRLHAVTLNFDDEHAADDALDVATVLASVSDEVRPLGDEAPVAAMVAVARRAHALRRSLAAGTLAPGDEQAVRRVQRRLVALRRMTALGAPFALWGRINHWLPFTLARTIGARTSTGRTQPAMHTVLAGIALVPLFYVAQTWLVHRLTGLPWSLLYAASLVPSASWDLWFSDRWRRMRRRARAWAVFRDDPALQGKLRDELFALR
ncbi:MAG: lysophospholipid acyltransferase family protein, partial [Gemmatimonadaceae bacterium]|nr:lysophospholipid acyltransferase family protein [Gemmatimonadaceae bacterium]